MLVFVVLIVPKILLKDLSILLESPFVIITVSLIGKRKMEWLLQVPLMEAQK